MGRANEFDDADRAFEPAARTDRAPRRRVCRRAVSPRARTRCRTAPAQPPDAQAEADHEQDSRRRRRPRPPGTCCSKVLTSAGFSMTRGQGRRRGAEALLRKRRFDLLLLDVWMPRMTGLDLLARAAHAQDAAARRRHDLRRRAGDAARRRCASRRSRTCTSRSSRRAARDRPRGARRRRSRRRSKSSRRGRSGSSWSCPARAKPPSAFRP